MTHPTIPAPAAPESVSWRAVELVRRKLSNLVITASDSDVARALGVSRGAIWGYKSGRDCMSYGTLLRVQQIAELSEAEFMELIFDLLLEENPPDANFLRKAKKKLVRFYRRQARTAVSILLGTVAVLGLIALPSQRVTASPAEATSPGIHILLTRLRGVWRRLQGWLGGRLLDRPQLGLRSVTAPAI